MPAKYVIHTKPEAHRFEPIARSGVIAWEEGCLKCAVCVKKQCVYGVYQNRSLDTRQMVESIDNQCMNCLSCVQNCPKELIHKSVNPQYKALGDAHWTPEIITRLWYQAETGKIPVSGAGYPGPFSGPGFDSMWTDMSEIVRPTRDGIHGREYISTAVDMGNMPAHLSFRDDGSLQGDGPEVISIPLPIMLRYPPFGATGQETLKGWAMAARRLGTLLAVPVPLLNGHLPDMAPWLVPVMSHEDLSVQGLPEEIRLVEIPWHDGWQDTVETLKRGRPRLLIAVRLPMAEGVDEQSLSLVAGGVSVVHLEGSHDGRFLDNLDRTLKDGIRSVHLKLVEASIRDRATLVVSGGLAMAEHVAKSLICGADAVHIDFPILIALECRMCRRCTKGLDCPVDIDEAPSSWVGSRTVNLLGAWHNQLLEVMGAMGIRDARRLRGEVGRAMFFEDLDRRTFGNLGRVEEGCQLE
jgi:ferredoxin